MQLFCGAGDICEEIQYNKADNNVENYRMQIALPIQIYILKIQEYCDKV